MINKPDLLHAQVYPNHRSVWSYHGELSVSDLQPQCVPPGDLQQFIAGWYCDACAVGFVPDEMAKVPRQLYVAKSGFFHPVNPDGSLGPPQLTISG